MVAYLQRQSHQHTATSIVNSDRLTVLSERTNKDSGGFKEKITHLEFIILEPLISCITFSDWAELRSGLL